MTVVTCAGCGARNASGATACAQCGRTLPGTVQFAASARQTSPPAAPSRVRHRIMAAIVALPFVVAALAVIGAVVLFFPLANIAVTGNAMSPTFKNGQLLVISKKDYPYPGPTHDDVIVFHAPPMPSRLFIQRVVGLPGDSVAIRPVGGVNRVVVNGHVLRESYIAEPPFDAFPLGCATTVSCKPYVVPRDSLFVLGDNRNASYDSRFWGALPLRDVVGKVLFVYWSR